MRPVPATRNGTAVKDDATTSRRRRCAEVGNEVRKRVARARESLLPETIDLAAEDEFGRPLQLHGTLVASCPWQAWGNFNANINLMRWESAGRITHGDCQEPIWNDYCNFIAARQRTL